MARSSPESPKEMEKVEVYLRLKPLNSDEESVAKVVDRNTIIIDPQLSDQKQLSGQKAVRYTFEEIFTEGCGQNTLFHRVALPALRDVLIGKPALIFMYGVTGSGKTYTMTGSPDDGGILPRTLDVLFNSIPSNLKAMKFLYKPDGLNGYEVRSVADAMVDRQTPAKKRLRVEQNAWLKRDRKERDNTIVNGEIPDYCKVAVFVQYVEIYNNYVYDLLEEESATVQGRAKGPQSKLIREDAVKNTFVFNTTEVEVENADEAMDVWLRGQSKKRVAHTQMNAESSRSHSVFMIRLVEAPINEKTGEICNKKEFITVTQLNLVDLAGCERAHKTAATGDRLKEASSINNSLMSLRQCLDALRENQLTNSNKMVPYRESKLTHLFKGFFEGRGKVKMVVCVNPRAQDCAETLEVMKFSESAQEIELQRVQVNKVAQYIDSTPPTSMEDLVFDNEPVCIPGCLAEYVHSEADLLAIQKLCKDGCKEMAAYRIMFDKTSLTIRDGVRTNFEELQAMKLKLSAREKDYRQKSRTLNELLSKANAEGREKDHLREKLIESDAKKEAAEKRALSLEQQLHKAKENQIRIKKDIESRWAKERELLVSKMDRVISEQKSEAMKKGAQIAKANLLKDIINVDEMKNIDSKSRTPKRPQPLKQRTQTFHSLDTRESRETRSSKKPTPSTSEPDLSDIEAVKTPHGPTLRNRRRSKSNDGRWLEHTDGLVDSDDVVMKPLMSKRKSVTRVECKDLEQVDKYALVTNEGSKVQVVKGDVLVSPTGGTAVVFTGVETLTKSKAGSTKRHHNVEDKEQVGMLDTKKRVSGIEGSERTTKQPRRVTCA